LVEGTRGLEGLEGSRDSRARGTRGLEGLEGSRVQMGRQDMRQTTHEADLSASHTRGDRNMDGIIRERRADRHASERDVHEERDIQGRT
jgi:hypothetical protein